MKRRAQQTFTATLSEAEVKFSCELRFFFIYGNWFLQKNGNAPVVLHELALLYQLPLFPGLLCPQQPHPDFIMSPLRSLRWAK